MRSRQSTSGSPALPAPAVPAIVVPSTGEARTRLRRLWRRPSRSGASTAARATSLRSFRRTPSTSFWTPESIVRSPVRAARMHDVHHIRTCTIEPLHIIDRGHSSTRTAARRVGHRARPIRWRAHRAVPRCARVAAARTQASCVATARVNTPPHPASRRADPRES